MPALQTVRCQWALMQIRFTAETTPPLYSNLQPSWLSAGALSLDYHSLSGTLQGAPAVLLTERRRRGWSYVTDSQKEPALTTAVPPWIPGLIIHFWDPRGDSRQTDEIHDIFLVQTSLSFGPAFYHLKLVSARSELIQLPSLD